MTGRGQLDLRALVRPTGASVAAEVEQRVNDSLAIYGSAWAGVDAGRAIDYGALAGLRVRW